MSNEHLHPRLAAFLASICPPEAKLTKKESISSVEYEIFGDLDQVLDQVKDLFDKYPGLGYGTRVSYMSELSDGSYGAVMVRAKSCE